MTDASRAALRRTELSTTGSLAAIFALRMFGLFMILPVFAVYGERLDGATPLLIGTAIGAYGLMQAMLQIPFGMLSDRQSSPFGLWAAFRLARSLGVHVWCPRAAQSLA